MQNAKCKNLIDVILIFKDFVKRASGFFFTSKTKINKNRHCLIYYKHFDI